MVREYSPTQVIIDLCHIHGIIKGEAGFGKLLFKQFAEEVFTLKTKNWTGPSFFFSCIAFKVQVVRMLLLFIMYEQEDALYITRFGGHCWYYTVREE